MKRSYLLLITLLVLLGSVSFAQEKYKNKDKYKKKEFCRKQNGSYNNSKVSSSDLRESTISAAGGVNVDSKNGRITVIGENRNDVLVRACVRVWAKTQAEADSKARSIRVVTSPVIKSENTLEKNWSVSYEIHVPKSSNLDLKSSNGRITISDVNGKVNFKTRNGRITLRDLAGDVRGETSNGRVSVKLSGNSWRGNGLNVKTRNGRISLYLPSNYSANVEAGTGNGRFSSDFEELRIRGKKRKYGSNRVSASINGGGAPISLSTGNGRVSIHSDKR